MTNPLRVLDAARSVVDDLNRLLDAPSQRLLHEDQLRKCSESITANIREAIGRQPGKERHQFLRFARGSAEETDEHLRTNYASNRLPGKRYWRFHNRLLTIVKMLNAMMS
jgi:four helix bundle protein